MGLLERARQLFGIGPAPLVDVPARVEAVDVDRLHVHTARISPDSNERLVILTVSAGALEHMGKAVQLTRPTERAVTFVPVKQAADPVLDPKLGWIIPVTPETAAELAALPPGPGEHELSSLHLGLVLV